jgi:hypothetical protein
MYHHWLSHIDYPIPYHYRRRWRNVSEEGNYVQHRKENAQ